MEVQRFQNSDTLRHAPANHFSPATDLSERPSSTAYSSRTPFDDSGAYHLVALPVLSGKFDSGICPAEAGHDAPPILKGNSQFQLCNYSLASLTDNSLPDQAASDLINSDDAPIDVGSSRNFETGLVNSNDCLIDSPACSGKLTERICHAEARPDAAHLNRRFVPQISTLAVNFDGCTTSDNGLAVVPGNAYSICPAEAVNDPAPSESSSHCYSSSDYVQTDARGAARNRLSFFYQNVRGLRTKIDDFYLAVSESRYDVIVLTETWLDQQILSPQLFGSGYSVFRNDRNQRNSSKSRGGGVLIAISTRINSGGDPSPVHDSLEQVWVKLKFSGFSISIGVLYLPPDRKADLTSISNHIESIESVFSNLGPNDHAFLFGDYNQSSLLWNTASTRSPTVDVMRSSISASSSTLLDGFNLHGLTQINNVLNRNGRLLDLVLVNETALGNCMLSEAVEPLSTLDNNHPALEIVTHLTNPLEFDDTIELDFDFSRADFDGLNDALLRVDWRFLDDAVDIDDAVDGYTGIIMSILPDYVPLRRPPSKPIWGNPRLRNLKRKRSKALRKYCRNRSIFAKQVLTRASNKYRLYNRLLYKRYTLRIQSNLRKNPKQFWNFVKSKRNETGLPTEMFLGTTNASSALEKCNLFATHFQSAFNDVTSTDSQAQNACRDTPHNVCELTILNLSTQQVSSAISKLKYSTAASPDGIPSCVLKRCCDALNPVLTTLFNISLKQHQFPSSWKQSIMFPVHKKGDKRNIENYRGITSLCASSKVFEIVVHSLLFAACKNYISTNQHGFYPKRSVSTNLVPFVSHCIRNMDNRLQTDVIYTDFKSAFDRVDHYILLKRLEILGISSNTIRWLESYLTERKLRVMIGSETSEVFSNLSGVPQGSNLGPLLFSLFINDLSRLLPPGCKLFFADDVKLYMTIRHLQDCYDLQRLIDCFTTWSTNNMLTLSINKCSTISFHRKQKPLCYDYSIDNHKLERVDRVRDLGVLLDSALTFRIHFEDVISRANRQLGFIFKICDEFKDPYCLRSLYCALVRPLLESNVVVWCPYHLTWKSRIEKVQRKFIRRALRSLPWRDPVHLPPYEDRCRLLGLDTLDNRRFVQQAVFAAKVLASEIDSPEILTRLSLYAPQHTIRHRGFLTTEPSNTVYGQHDPISAISTAFNEVYAIFDFDLSTDAFRRRLLQRNHNRA